MMDAAVRSSAIEWMDTQPVGMADYRACLEDMSAANRLTLGYRPTLAYFDRATRGWPPGRSFSVLDVGFGYGDMLRRLRRWADERRFRVELSGVDLHPWSAGIAAAVTPAGMAIRYETGDAFALPKLRYDFIICSLMTHHLSDAQLVTFLGWLDSSAVRGWFINDLHRHAVPYYLFAALAALAGWHRFVRHDGPVSIARGFRKEDWQVLLDRAGVSAAISWHMPYRLCVAARR